MRSIIIAAVAFGCAALAHHGHAHVHNHVKKDVIEEKVEITVTECWLSGHSIPQADCDEGLRNGTLKFVDDGSIASASSAAPAPQTTLSTLIASQKPAAIPSPSPPAPVAASPAPAAAPSPPVAPKPAQLPASPPPPAAPAPPTPAAPAPPPAAAPTSKSGWVAGGAAANVNTAFPDGQLDCSSFPDQYGAVRTDWLGLGGWASVQKPNVVNSAGYNDILTVTKAQCEGSTCCLEGSFCSYACPNGYLKYQWPSMQGATGQSVGGLYCQNGKLHLSNPSVPTLCATGSTAVKVQIKNTIGQNVAVCRTNYPGDEKMSIPLNATPGSVKKLACPDASAYYKWEGKGTSAQYYINMPGYSVEKACVWGQQGDDFGNFAPGNLGVGYADGRAWLSITANHPTQMTAQLPYTIEIVGGDSKCRYQSGQYCTGDNYENCGSEGCTVSSSGNDMTYVIS